MVSNVPCTVVDLYTFRQQDELNLTCIMSSLATTEENSGKAKREHSDISSADTSPLDAPPQVNFPVPKKKKKGDYKKQWLKTRKSGTRIGADFQCNIPAIVPSKPAETAVKKKS